MPHRMVGILSLLLVFALEMRAQGEVVLSIDGEPVKRSEFEYYFRKSSHRTPLSFLPSFIKGLYVSVKISTSPTPNAPIVSP